MSETASGPRVDRRLVGVFVFAAVVWLVWMAVKLHRPPDPTLHRADGVTGCGELVVGEVTVALWGVEIDDCDGANALLQHTIVERERAFHVTRGACRLVDPDSAPAWDCQHPDDRRAMPEREPPRPGPLTDSRVEALAERITHPVLWTAQAELIRAGVARISAACEADLATATRDPMRRWPAACRKLWLAQCQHDSKTGPTRYDECFDRYRDPS